MKKGGHGKVVLRSTCISLAILVCGVGCKNDNEEAPAGASSTGAAPQERVSDEDIPEPREASEGGRATTVAGSATKAGKAGESSPEETQPEADKPKPFALSDLATVKVHPGMPSPKVGDTIYSMANLPANTCGEFWVKDDDGYVAIVAQCNGQHAGGH